MPDAEKWFAFFDGLYDLYRQSGPAPAPTAQPFHPPPPCAGHLGFNEPGIGRQAVGAGVHQDGDLEDLDRLDHR